MVFHLPTFSSQKPLDFFFLPFSVIQEAGGETSIDGDGVSEAPEAASSSAVVARPTGRERWPEERNALHRTTDGVKKAPMSSRNKMGWV
ncbi:hypothetical protein V6N13_091378 [Hibiscus sabdariffa]